MTKLSRLYDIKDKVVIVTGGAGMLGQTYCEGLAEAGARVVIVDISQKDCDTLARKLTRNYGRKTIGIGTDISQKNSVDKMVQKVMAEFGKIDILINNAAIDDKVDKDKTDTYTPFEDYPAKLISKFISVNLQGMIYCCQAVGKAMINQRKGAVVNIASTYGVVAPDQRIYKDAKGKQKRCKSVAYSVTKAAVIQLTKYLAVYWAPHGVRVNTLTPGGVLAGQDREFIKNYSSRTPMGRMAGRDEFLGALLFLVSDASSYMTGANLIVDGGWTAW